MNHRKAHPAVLWLLTSLVAVFPARAAAPSPDPRAVVTAGNARFTVLTPQLIRLEWAAGAKFEDHASLVFINRRLPVPEFTRESRDGATVIRTAALRLEYKPGPSGDKFSPENLSISFDCAGRAVVWKPGMKDSGNLLGTTRTLDGVRGDNAKLEPGLISRDGWTVVDDSTRPLFDSADFSFPDGEASPWPWVMPRPPGDRIDWYFFGYGHDYRQALHDYTLVAGSIPLPPRFAFGAWWSRYWAYSDRELVDLVNEFHSHEVPLDVLVIDMEWHKTFGNPWGKLDDSLHQLGWTGYSWNKLLFPDPDRFLAWVHSQGLKATLNLHPASGVQPWEDRYPEMPRAMGIDPATKQYVPFDIANKRFATNYLNILHHPLERQGIDFWWLDWQQEDKTSLEGVNPTWWLNYTHFTDQERQGKRPLIFHRWGGLGNHRYQIGFSGDTVSVWESLAFQPYFTATAANVGYAYWSHDIGGHMPGAVSPELYTRWIQFGAFSPILRTHTTKNADAERRIWAYPEPYAEIMRNAVLLRYALLPYVYTEARRTYDTGLAFLHPLYYDWPEKDAAYTASEYAFGDSMLVAPVVQPVDPKTGLAEESIWIPPGEWIEWSTGGHFKGPATVTRRYSISQIPVFMKAGAIVPMQPEMRYSGEKPLDPLIVNVFPLARGQASTYRLYEDGATTLGYKQDEFAWTELAARRDADTTTITIGPLDGRFAGMPEARGYEIRLPGNWPPEEVSVNGEAIPYRSEPGKSGWQYAGSTLTTVITLPPTSVHTTLRIRVRTAAGSCSDRDLEGFAGVMTRLREAYDAMNQGRAGWSPDVLIDAMQTGTRLGYDPSGACREIERLTDALPAIVSAVEASRTPNGKAPTEEEKARRAASIDRVMALLADARELLLPAPRLGANPH